MIASLMVYASLIALLMGLAAWALERVAAAFGQPRRAVWAATIIASFVLPACMIWIAQQQPIQTIPWGEWEKSGELSVENQPVSPVIEAVPEEAARRQSFGLSWTAPRLPNLDGVLGPLWLAASLSLLGVLGASWMRLRYITRNLPRREIDGVVVHVTSGIGPATFGILKPTIIFPQWLVEAPHTTRAMVLAHELSHVRARDPMLFVLALVLVCLAPWNVPLWWQLRRLRFAIEVDCDQRVVREGTDVSAYGEMLLTVWQHHSGFPIGVVALIERVSQMEKRIQIMTGKRTQHALVLAACGIAATSFVIAGAQMEPPAVSASAADSTLANELPSTGVFRSVPLERLDEDGTDEPSSENRIVFSTTDPVNSPKGAEMRRRLQDPEERKRLREEQRANVREQNPELSHVLQIDQSTEAALIELLTDEAMDNLERFWVQFPGTAVDRSRSPFTSDLQEQAERENRRLAKLQKVLGPDGFERYQDYKKTVQQRIQVIRFEARLGPADKLMPDQKERLIAMLHDHRRKELALLTGGRQNLMDLMSLPVDPAMRRELMRKQMLRRDAVHTRNVEESSRQLLERLPQVLTPQQLDVFSKLEAEKVDAQRKYVEKKLAREGLKLEDLLQEPDFANAPSRRAVTGPIRFDVYIEINRKPLELSVRTENGKAVSFQAPEGLWVETTPTLYEDGWLDVDITYFEGPEGRRREIGSGGQGTMIRRYEKGARNGGGGSSMIRGTKAYATSHSFNAAPIATEIQGTVPL